LVYRDGLVLATLAGGEAHLRSDLDPETSWRAQKALARGSAPAASPGAPETAARTLTGVG
jgi:hypothetical protein